MGSQNPKSGTLAAIIILAVIEIFNIFGLVSSINSYLSLSNLDLRRLDFFLESIIRLIIVIVLLISLYFFWRKYKNSKGQISTTNPSIKKLLSAKIMQWIFIVIFWPISVLLFIYTFTTVKAAFFIFCAVEIIAFGLAIWGFVSLFTMSSELGEPAATIFYSIVCIIYGLVGLPLLYFLRKNYHYLKYPQKQG